MNKGDIINAYGKKKKQAKERRTEGTITILADHRGYTHVCRSTLFAVWRFWNRRPIT